MTTDTLNLVPMASGVAESWGATAAWVAVCLSALFAYLARRSESATRTIRKEVVAEMARSRAIEVERDERAVASEVLALQNLGRALEGMKTSLIRNQHKDPARVLTHPLFRDHGTGKYDRRIEEVFKGAPPSIGPALKDILDILETEKPPISLKMAIEFIGVALDRLQTQIDTRTARGAGDKSQDAS